MTLLTQPWPQARALVLSCEPHVLIHTFKQALHFVLNEQTNPFFRLFYKLSVSINVLAHNRLRNEKITFLI